MEIKSDVKLALNPEVIVNKENKQETTAIDKKYGVSLFGDPVIKQPLYLYQSANDNIYRNQKSYQLEIATDKFASIYSSPEVYAVDTQMMSGDYTSVIYIIIGVQLVVIGYFIIRIVKVRSRL